MTAMKDEPKRHGEGDSPATTASTNDVGSRGVVALVLAFVVLVFIGILTVVTPELRSDPDESGQDGGT